MKLIRSALMLSGGLIAQGASAAWVNIDELNAPNLAPGSGGMHLGQSIAVDVRADGSLRTLYVGMPNATVTFNDVDVPQAGVVLIYTRVNGQWQYFDFLRSNLGPSANAHFGAAVAVKNGSIIVGEPDFDANGHTDSGRVVFFQDYRWNSQFTPFITSLTSRESALDNARLGASVAVSGSGLDGSAGDVPGDGSWFAAGAPGMVGAGCAFVTHIDHDFIGPGAHQDMGSVCANSSGDALGASIAIDSLGVDQALLVAGAPGTMQNGNALAGAAHAYMRNNGSWILIDTLVPPNPAILDVVGTSIAIDEVTGNILVGATGRDLSGVGRTGSVSIFEPAFILGYDFQRELFPTAPRAPGDLCGASVGIDLGGDEGFVMGCPGADGSVTNQGVMRVYRPFVFMGNTVWTNQRIALDEEPHGVDDFGRSVILVDDRAYAGAPYADDAVGTDNGAVFEFGNGVVIDDMFANGFE